VDLNILWDLPFKETFSSTTILRGFLQEMKGGLVALAAVFLQCQERQGQIREPSIG